MGDGRHPQKKKVPSSQAAFQDALGGGQRIATQAATGMGMAKDLRDPTNDLSLGSH